MSLLKAFTTQLKNLIIELSEVLPYNKEISVNKTTIELLIRTNPRLVLNAFNIYILPYKNEIINCDDKFFISQDIRESENINMDSKTKRQVCRRQFRVHFNPLFHFFKFGISAASPKRSLGNWS